MSKNFTERLGGTIALESDVGVGTTFIISIPVRRSSQQPEEIDKLIKI